MARGQTMSRQERKAIKRNRRRQLYVWGGHYSLRGMTDPGKMTASADKEVQLAAVAKKVQERAAKRGWLGRIMHKLFGS